MATQTLRSATMALLALLPFVGGCGGEELGEAGPRSSSALSEAPLGPLPEACSTSQVVIVVAIDGLRSDRVDLFGYPHATTPFLSSLAGEALFIEDGLADSATGGPALASLVAGQGVLEHRLGSLREPGAARLPEGAVTWAERRKQQDWHSLASVALPQHAPELGSLDQGFDRYLYPDWSDGTGRSAAQVYHLLESGLSGHASQGEPFFALLHFADPRYKGPAPGEVGAAFLKAHLSSFADRLPKVAAALEQVDDDPEEAQAALNKALGRSRGSEAYLAWQSALYDGRLAYCDAFLGRLIELLRSHERWEETTLVVTGLRGHDFGERPAEGRPAFDSQQRQVPMVLKLAGGQPAGRLDLTAQPSDLLPTVEEILGEEPETQDLVSTQGRSFLAFLEDRGTFPTTACIASSDLSLLTVWGRRHGVERGVDGKVRWLDRAAAQYLAPNVAPASESMEAAELQRLERWVQVAAQGPQLQLVQGALAGTNQVLVNWRLHDGYCVGRSLEGEGEEIRRGARAEVAGRFELGEGTYSWDLSRRSLPMELELRREGAALAEADVFVGTQRLSESLLPRVPASEAESWPEEEAALASLRFRGDGWWTFELVEARADQSVQLLMALHPPEKLNDRLEWSAGQDVSVEPLPGRLDALLVKARGPFVLDVKKSTQRDLALGLLIDGLAPDWTRVQVRGKRFGQAGVVQLYLPDWMKGITDPLMDLDGSSVLPGLLRLGRVELLLGLSKNMRRGIPAEWIDEVWRLGAYE